MLVLVAPLPLLWPRPAPRAADAMRWPAAVCVAIAGLALMTYIASTLAPVIFLGPVDPVRGDMLVIVQHAIDKFLGGGHPYSVHHVPWDAPLSYGPVLWTPFVLPHVLRVDYRILTLAAQLTIPAAAWIAAARRAGHGSWLRAAGLAALGTVLALHPDIHRFVAIGHTQIYWPLLLIFAALVAGERWTAAAVCLGLLVAARSTMIAIVPVFAIHLAVTGKWSWRPVVAFTLAAASPFLPFVIADAKVVWYAMVGVYLKVMTGFVWQQTNWVVDTFGITGRLLERGIERYAGIAQALSMLATCLLAWRAMARGARPEPWMAISLLVFSMTTLWPVLYLYFDVWVLLACGLVAADGVESGRPPRAIRGTLATCAVALATVLVAVLWRPGASFRLDIGDPRVSGYTGGGFGRDEAVAIDGRSVVWIEGETARVRVPRAGFSGAAIRIAIRPASHSAGSSQTVAAALNGEPRLAAAERRLAGHRVRHPAPPVEPRLQRARAHVLVRRAAAVERRQTGLCRNRLDCRGVTRLPDLRGTLDCAGQDGLPNVVDGRQPASRGGAPLESGGVRRPVKERDPPRVGAPAALVVHETVIGRAAGGDQSTKRQLRVGARGAALELGSGLGDVERLTAEERLQPVAHAEWKTSDRSDNLEPLVPHVVAQRPGQGCGRGGLARRGHGRPGAQADRAEQATA
jgi:hypothetical protein